MLAQGLGPGVRCSLFDYMGVVMNIWWALGAAVYIFVGHWIVIGAKEWDDSSVVWRAACIALWPVAILIGGFACLAFLMIYWLKHCVFPAIYRFFKKI